MVSFCFCIKGVCKRVFTSDVVINTIVFDQFLSCS